MSARSSATDTRARDRKRYVPGCGACNGSGRVHVQVPGRFRVESRECQCWRLQDVPAEPADSGLCLRCLGTGGVDPITRGKNAGESVMCTYCGGSGRVRR